MTNDPHSIEVTFRTEFGPVANFFELNIFSVEEARISSESYVFNPGVYVWFNNDQVIKVGRSFDNARKRSFEHLTKNTAGTMAELENDPSARVCYITTTPDNKHWIAAAEVYLELNLNLQIPSDRIG